MPRMAPAFLTSSTDTTETYSIPSEVIQAIVSFVTSSIYTLLPPVLAFFSGQLWIFVVCFYTDIPKKSRKSINKWYGRVALGLAWQALVLIPTYVAFFGNLHIQTANLLEIEFTVLAISFALQLPVVGLIILLHKLLHKGGSET